MKKHSIRRVAVSALVLAAACESATGPGSGAARMQLAAAGDDRPATTTTPAEGASYQQTTAQGTVSFSARAYVQTQAGAWVELTEGAYESVSVAASSAASSARVFATSQLEATSYSRVRLVFRNVRADVEGGLQVGVGFASGSVSVDAGSDGEIVVEREVSVTASAGATTRLLLDLNSNVWLNQASAQSRAVSETAFASAVQVVAQ